LRVFLTIVLPLALPTVLYLLWLQAARRPRAWRVMPFVWLIGAGVVLLAIVLFVVTVHFGTPETGVYVPPHLRGGEIVPGHIEPAKRP
jgi:hypothetical protein